MTIAQVRVVFWDKKDNMAPIERRRIAEAGPLCFPSNLAAKTVRPHVDMGKLTRCAGEPGWLRYQGHDVDCDEGRAITWERSLRSRHASSFRLLVPSGGMVGSLYGYSDAETSRDVEQLVGNAIPASWTDGRRIGFDLRVCPVRRLKENHGRCPFRKGTELGAFFVEVLRGFPVSPAGMAGTGHTREAVSLARLVERFTPVAEPDRVWRGTGSTEGPVATSHGVPSGEHLR